MSYKEVKMNHGASVLTEALGVTKDIIDHTVAKLTLKDFESLSYSERLLFVVVLLDNPLLEERIAGIRAVSLMLSDELQHDFIKTALTAPKKSMVLEWLVEHLTTEELDTISKIGWFTLLCEYAKGETEKIFEMMEGEKDETDNKA